MRNAAIVLAGIGLAGAWTWSAVLGDRPARPPAAPAAPANPAVVARGAYLVNEVARCGDCHTPRDRRGRPDASRHLQGATMWFAPKDKEEEWEDHAPDITQSGKAGKWTEDRMVRLLTRGKESDPPMPAYRLTDEDARAVTAYLRSLPGKNKGDQKNDDRRGRRERRRDRERDDD